MLESSPYASRESTTESGTVEIKVFAKLDGIGSLAISNSCGSFCAEEYDALINAGESELKSSVAMY